MASAELQQLIESQKQASFIDPSTASDDEALGILVSNHYEWDGIGIMRAFAAALEDANFHTNARMIDDWIDALR
jgi:hypothetical protein